MIDLFWFNVIVVGLVTLAIVGGWLRHKLKRHTLHLYSGHLYRKGDTMVMTHGADSHYNGRYKVLKINRDAGTVIARRTFRG